MTSTAAAVVAITVGITAVISHSRDASSTHHDPPVTQPSGELSPLEWAQGLPSGASPTLAYILDGTLHQGNITVPVPGDQAELIGATASGWLVFQETDNRQGLPAQTGYGVLTRTGEFQKLPPDPYQGSVQVQALSPDGTTFATGGALIDLRTFQVVGRTPTDAYFAATWTTRGLLYFDSDNKTWLWNQGTAAVRVDASSFTDVARDAPIAVTDRQSGCGRVTQIRGDGTLKDLYIGCDATTPMTVSPDGRFALTKSLDVVDLNSGEAVGALGIPAEVAKKSDWFGWWESDHSILFSLEGQPGSRNILGDATGSRPAVIVRCEVASESCQRAGPELSLDPSTALELK